ncbi:WhiB family transcriptional regulator [Actinacidiphila glaucinigra]|uniref:WhiB family transcriptional regulator n=1 Tax=Actinacidiphila glaucinigra TaxID=235986 RepID=UPI0036843FF6
MSDADALFVEGAEQHRAKAVWTGCTVRTECLAYALDHRIEDGIWGGMTERERRPLLRRRPTVASWHALLEAARRKHLQTGPGPRSSGQALREAVSGCVGGIGWASAGRDAGCLVTRLLRAGPPS